LRVFENRALRRMFGPKKDEVIRGWRKLYNDETYDLYSSSNIRMIKSRRMIFSGYLARMGEMRNWYKILVWKPEGKRSLGRPRSTWNNRHNIKIDLKEIG
jgi:hypothetical protein